MAKIHDDAINYVYEQLDGYINKKSIEYYARLFLREIKQYLNNTSVVYGHKTPRHFLIPYLGTLYLKKSRFLRKILNVVYEQHDGLIDLMTYLKSTKWYLVEYGIEGFKFVNSDAVYNSIIIDYKYVYTFHDIYIYAYAHLFMIGAIEEYKYLSEEDSTKVKDYIKEHVVQPTVLTNDEVHIIYNIVDNKGEVRVFHSLNKLVDYIYDNSKSKNKKYIKQNIRRGRNKVNGYDIHRIFK